MGNDQAAARILAGELKHRDWIFGLKDCELFEAAEDAAYIVTRGIVGNVTVIGTEAGLLLCDSGTGAMAARILEVLREYTGDPVHTIVLTHGHWDHVAGVPTFDSEAKAQGVPRPQLIGHAAIPGRLERYLATGGFNTVINQRQFPGANLNWPPPHRFPDTTYEERATLDLGGRAIELNHARGETDDHTWLWIADRKLVVSGDFFIWSGPNCGNPQKVQRYAKDWADALRAMIAKNPEILIPGHGPAIYGAAAIGEVLANTAEYLESLHDSTLALMNAGKSLDYILHHVQVSSHLSSKPYLRPTYDHPEFVVRNVWRLYGGWYDGNPANLMPAPEAELALELAALAGGAENLAARAEALAGQGSYRLAGHLAETATLAAPDNPETHRVRAKVYKLRAEQETSIMARGIFFSAAKESEEAIDG